MVLAEVTIPKLLAWEFVEGEFQLGWFEKLNDSNRNSKRWPSMMPNSVVTEKYQLRTPGVRSMFRPTVPKSR